MSGRSIRTTIRLPDDLLHQAKRLAAETDRTLTRVIEEVLRKTLSRRHNDRTAARSVYLTTVDRGTAFDGIDLDNTASLLDRVEGLGMKSSPESLQYGDSPVDVPSR